MISPDEPHLPKHLTSEQFLTFSLSGIKTGRWHLNKKNTSISVDENFQILFNNHTSSTLSIDSFSALISESDRTRFLNVLEKALSPGSPNQLNMVIGSAGSKSSSVHLIGQAYLDDDGEVGGIIGSAVEIPHFENGPDLQKHNKPEKGLTDKNPGNELFRTLISEAPVATCLFAGKDMVIEIANDMMIGYWGKDSSVIGKPLLEAIPELRGQVFPDILDEIYRTGVAYESKNAPAELEVGGQLSTFYFDFTYKPLFDADGNVYGIMDMAIDVTAQAIYLKELQASQERFRSIISSAPVAMGIFTGRDMIVDVPNQAFIDIIGKGQDIAGKKLADLMPELESQDFLKLLDNVFTSGEPFQNYGAPVDILKDGKMVRSYFNVSFTPLKNADGEVYAVLDISVDVTEVILAKQQDKITLEKQVNLRTRQLKDSLADLERSNTNLLQFAYVASHDLQEPLRKIQTFSDLLRKRYTTELGSGIDHLNRIQTAASRMSILIRDLLDFSGISTGNVSDTLISLNHILDHVLIDLEINIAESEAQILVAQLPAVKGDSTQLSQLFTNLLSNAIKFRRLDIPPEIEITCTSVIREHLPMQVTPTRHAAAYYRIDVADNGIGFDSKYANRIFQVFQRLHSKAEFDGTGIGLAICEKVAANHGGAIKASGIPGKGSTFSVFLPV